MKNKAKSGHKAKFDPKSKNEDVKGITIDLSLVEQIVRTNTEDIFSFLNMSVSKFKEIKVLQLLNFRTVVKTSTRRTLLNM